LKWLKKTKDVFVLYLPVPTLIWRSGRRHVRIYVNDWNAARRSELRNKCETYSLEDNQMSKKWFPLYPWCDFTHHLVTVGQDPLWKTFGSRPCWKEADPAKHKKESIFWYHKPGHCLNDHISDWQKIRNEETISSTFGIYQKSCDPVNSEIRNQSTLFRFVYSYQMTKSIYPKSKTCNLKRQKSQSISLKLKMENQSPQRRLAYSELSTEEIPPNSAKQWTVILFPPYRFTRWAQFGRPERLKNHKYTGTYCLAHVIKRDIVYLSRLNGMKRTAEVTCK
jgi:hypothetical protein